MPTKKGAMNTSTSTKQPAVVTTMPTKKVVALNKTTTPTKKVVALNRTKKPASPKKTTKKAPKKTASEAAALFSSSGARCQSLSLKFATTSNSQMKQMDKTSSTSTDTLE
jgi:hypothetical protein